MHRSSRVNVTGLSASLDSFFYFVTSLLTCLYIIFLWLIISEISQFYLDYITSKSLIRKGVKLCSLTGRQWWCSCLQEQDSLSRGKNVHKSESFLPARIKCATESLKMNKLNPKSKHASLSSLVQSSEIQSLRFMVICSKILQFSTLCFPTN